jgi:FkbM family methyltransferase
MAAEPAGRHATRIRPTMTAEHDIDILVRRAFFPHALTGVLVEVGAGRPDYLSISAMYRTLGWKIISVEPNPDFCAEHRARGYEVLQYAASDAEADDVEFFVVDLHGLSYMGGNVSFESFSSLGIQGQYADMYNTLKSNSSLKSIFVKVRKLDSILAEHEPEATGIDLLAVDVEGWELNVMRGLSLARYRPSVVILENLFNDSKYLTYMEEQGYDRWQHIFPNDVYVRRGFKPTPYYEEDLTTRYRRRPSA